MVLLWLILLIGIVLATLYGPDASAANVSIYKLIYLLIIINDIFCRELIVSFDNLSSPFPHRSKTSVKAVKLINVLILRWLSLRVLSLDSLPPQIKSLCKDSVIIPFPYCAYVTDCKLSILIKKKKKYGF